MTWQNLIDGLRHDFNFRDLTEVHANIQRNNTYLSFREADGTRVVYRLIGYPQLPAVGIDVHFSVEMYRPNGEQIGLRKDLARYNFQEPDQFVPLFAMHVPTQGGMAFGLQQAINGLTRRLTQFEGHPQLQTGHMLYTMDGDAVQPVTFDLAVTEETGQDVSGEWTGQGDGTVTLTEIDGTGPFEFSLDGGQTYQATGLFENLAAGDYTVAVRDSLGIWHSKKVTVNIQEAPPAE